MSNNDMTDPRNPVVIAKTILAQIGSNTLACIGVPPRSIVAIPASDQHLGGVTFKFSNCPKVRNGSVKVTLSGNDTYNVSIFNCRGRALKEMSDIYCDQLAGPHGIIEQVTG